MQFPSSAQAPTPPLVLPSTARLQIASELFNQTSTPNSTNPFHPRKRFESHQVTNRDKIRQPASYFHEDNLDTVPEQENPSKEANGIEDLDINEPEDGSFSYYLDEKGYHIGADIIPAPLHQFSCLVCNIPFPSNNLLHQHLRLCLPPLPANHIFEQVFNSGSITLLAHRIRSRWACVGGTATTSYDLSLIDPYCGLDRSCIYIWFVTTNKTFSNKHG